MVSMFKKRALAYLIDWFVISATLMILAQVLAIIVITFSLFIVYNFFVYLLPVFILIYFVYLETKKGKTIGKDILDLRVVSEEGENITYREAIIRNLSKLYWLPIIIDIIIGKYFGDSDERILGQWSKTMVIELENHSDEADDSEDVDGSENEDGSFDDDSEDVDGSENEDGSFDDDSEDVDGSENEDGSLDDEFEGSEESVDNEEIEDSEDNEELEESDGNEENKDGKKGFFRRNILSIVGLVILISLIIFIFLNFYTLKFFSF